MEKNITVTIYILALGAVIFVINAIIESRPKKGEFWSDWFTNIKSYFSSFYTVIAEPSRAILLPPPLPLPYHQPKYTLVIEIKDVLTHTEYDWKNGYRYKKRPGLEKFLDVAGYPNFELVIYTDESPAQDGMLFPGIDPHQRIMYRLYRDCTRWDGKTHLKVLDKLDRDLSKVIFIDTEPRATEPRNQLLIPKWDGDMNDTSLLSLATLLATIHLNDVEDVRPTLEFYNTQDVDAITAFKRNLEKLKQEERAKMEVEVQKSSSYTSKFSDGFRKRLY